MSRSSKTVSTIGAIVGFLACSINTSAQVKLDISSDQARKAAGVTNLDDLSVHDTALINENFCIKDGGLYVPGWTVPANLSDAPTWAASGIILRIEILPTRKIKGVWVDAARAQHIAQGNATVSSALSTDDYNKLVRESINIIFSGGLFGVNDCDDLQRRNSMRQMTLYTVETINGYSTISELLSSVKPKSDK
jgi:hypothetical protein